MSVASPLFLAVAAFAVLAVWATRGRLPRDTVLLAASLVFAAVVLAPAAAVALAAFLAVGYGALRAIDAWQSRAAMPLAVGCIVFAFWLLRPADPLAGGPSPSGLPAILGLSYVMFRLIHLLVDRHEGALAEPIGLRAYLGYLLFFPNFMAGPIQRYEHLAPQLSRAGDAPDAAAVAAALGRVATGYFKLVVVAGLAAGVLAERWSALADASGAAQAGVGFAVACLAFAVQLYASFSGYMDVVVGLGRLMAIDIPENFDRPFAAPNFLDLWSRWHITLSDWFKIYVFNPVVKGAMGVIDRPAAAPLLGVAGYFLTFLLMGIWHGTTVTFLAFGLLLGLGVSVNKAYQFGMTGLLGRKGYRALIGRAWYQVAAQTLTVAYFVLAVALVWIRPEEVPAAAARVGVAGLLVAAAAVTLAAAAIVGAVRAVDALRARAASGGPIQGLAIAGLQLAATAWYLIAWGGTVPELIYQKF